MMPMRFAFRLFDATPAPTAGMSAIMPALPLLIDYHYATSSPLQRHCLMIVFAADIFAASLRCRRHASPPPRRRLRCRSIIYAIYFHCCRSR
jgi:hypothetical protein